MVSRIGHQRLWHTHTICRIGWQRLWHEHVMHWIGHHKLWPEHIIHWTGCQRLWPYILCIYIYLYWHFGTQSTDALCSDCGSRGNLGLCRLEWRHVYTGCMNECLSLHYKGGLQVCIDMHLPYGLASKLACGCWPSSLVLKLAYIVACLIG